MSTSSRFHGTFLVWIDSCGKDYISNSSCGLDYCLMDWFMLSRPCYGGLFHFNQTTISTNWSMRRRLHFRRFQVKGLDSQHLSSFNGCYLSIMWSLPLLGGSYLSNMWSSSLLGVSLTLVASHGSLVYPTLQEDIRDSGGKMVTASYRDIWVLCKQKRLEDAMEILLHCASIVWEHNCGPNKSSLHCITSTLKFSMTYVFTIIIYLLCMISCMTPCMT